MRIKSIICCLLGLGCLLTFNACFSVSDLVIETDSSAPLQSIKKVVTIDPEYTFSDTRKREERIYLASDKQEVILKEELLANASRHDLELVVFDKETLSPDEVDFYNELQPLRYQILTSNFTQEVEAKQDDRNKGFFKRIFYPKTYEFTDNPVISPVFSHLAEKYGTPYFAVHGVFSEIVPNQQQGRFLILLVMPPLGIMYYIKPQISTYYFQIITDVRSGKVVHREIRRTDNAASKENLKLMIYDSFNIFLNQI